MQVTSWHPGKLVLLWGLTLAVLALLLFARPAACYDVALSLWLVLIAPLGLWTWKWFDARENTPSLGESASDQSDKQSEPSRLKRWILRVVWFLAALYLLLLYLDCSSGTLRFS